MTADDGTVFIARAATWWFWNDGVDRGTGWRQHDWTPPTGVSSATAPLGYGESYVNPIPSCKRART